MDIIQNQVSEYVYQSIIVFNLVQANPVWFVRYYGISTFVGYLKPNPFLCK